MDGYYEALHQAMLDAEDWDTVQSVNLGVAITLTGQRIPINTVRAVSCRLFGYRYILYLKLKNGTQVPYMSTDTKHHAEIIKTQLVYDLQTSTAKTVLRGDDTCKKLKLGKWARDSQNPCTHAYVPQPRAA